MILSQAFFFSLGAVLQNVCEISRMYYGNQTYNINAIFDIKDIKTSYWIYCIWAYKYFHDDTFLSIDIHSLTHLYFIADFLQCCCKASRPLGLLLIVLFHLHNIFTK